jgi:hypothetical protein
VPAAPIRPDELPDRLAACARILDAWPNARPLNRDRTLVEYVNATRGVPLERLGRVIQLAIDAGGDFMPPAGEILRRAATEALGGAPVGSDRDAAFWFQKRLRATLRRYQEAAERTAPLNPDQALTTGSTQRRIGP